MNCIICGKEIERSVFSNAHLCSSDCFDVNFWNETLDQDAIVVNGECYHDFGNNKKIYGFLGHGGKRFAIRKNDGTILMTNNLWYNGKVPEERNVRDNAEFL